MTAKIEPYCQTCGEFIPEPNVAYGISPDALCRCCKHDRIAAHAPKETGIKPDTAQAARQEPSVPVNKSEQRIIIWHHSADILPPRYEVVLVRGGIAEWTGRDWITQTGEDSGRPIQWAVKWWAYFPFIPEDDEQEKQP